MVVDANRDRMVLMIQCCSFERLPVSVAPTKEGQNTQSMVVPIRERTSETLSGKQFSLAPESSGTPMARLAARPKKAPNTAARKAQHVRAL